MGAQPVITSLKRNVPLRETLGWFAVTRNVLLVLGYFTRRQMAAGADSDYVWHYSSHWWLDIWGVWDSGWYLQIARNGYPAGDAAALGDTAEYAFFPLYPMLMRWLAPIFHNEFIAGIVLSNLALLLSGMVLYRLVEHQFGRGPARWAVVALFLFPVSFILSGVFTESLFLLFTLLAFRQAQLRQWWWVGVFGLLAGLTRSLGLLLVLPMAWEYMHSKGWRWRAIRPGILWLALIPLGYVTHGYLTYRLTGDFFALFHLVPAWGGSWQFPLLRLWEGLGSPYPFMPLFALFGSTALILLLAYVRKLPFSYVIFGLYCLLVPASLGLMSMPRHSLVVFPLFVALALAAERFWLRLILFSALAALQVVLAVHWFQGSTLVV
ncbi:MAG: mannosyltransferase family protein [Bacteroidota bacterium]